MERQHQICKILTVLKKCITFHTLKTSYTSHTNLRFDAYIQTSLTSQTSLRDVRDVWDVRNVCKRDVRYKSKICQSRLQIFDLTARIKHFEEILVTNFQFVSQDLIDTLFCFV